VVAQSTVAKYMAGKDDPSGQSWGTFLHNHAPHIAAMDLFVVPTIGFNLLYVLVIVRLARRELVWINTTAHPTAEWVAQQITEAFPWNEVPRYLVRDRDGIYGATVTRRLRAMDIRDKPIAAGSPWQNAYGERLLGTIRRECLDHMIVFGETQLRRILAKYAAITMKRELIDPWTRIPRSIGRLSASALSHHSLCWEVFIANIAESDFRHAQPGPLAEPL
jgi:transposase InsO family protein